MKIQEAASYIGVSVNTLKEMANKGTIVCHKTAGGHRRFQREYLDLFMGVRPKRGLFDERRATGRTTRLLIKLALCQ